MRVGINARALAKPSPTGIGRYTMELVSAIAETNLDIQCVLYGIDQLPSRLTSYDSITVRGGISPDHSGGRAHLWEQVILPVQLLQDDIEVFHSPGGKPPIRSPVPTVTTIHDVAPLVHPEWFSSSYSALYRVLIPKVVRAADLIISVSEFTRSELVRLYPDVNRKVRVVHNGINHNHADASPPDLDLQSNGFFLFVGANNPRKNIKLLLEAYRTYRSCAVNELNLVVVGPDREIFPEMNLSDERIYTPGYVSDDELQWLYRNACCLVYPSLYEGFGLPILEAMSVGTPVITSNRGAMAEIAGKAAWLVNPESRDELVRAMVQVASDEDTQFQLADRGRNRAADFRWEKTARQTVDVYRQAK